MRISSRLINFVVLGSLIYTCPSYSADKWLSIHSTNFLLVGHASESSIRRVGRELEEFRTALAMIFPRVNQPSSVGTTVIVFKDDASFKPYKPLYQGKAGNVAGYFQAGEDANFIALAADTPSPHVVYHEFVHSLTRDSALPLPLWASEGLAEVYGMFQITGREVILGRAIGEHIQTLRQQPLMPLSLLLSVEHSSPNYNENTRQGMFYAESWALVHFLMFENNAQRRPQFAKYLNLSANGKSIDENYREAFQTDPKTLEEQIRKYIQSQVAWPAIIVKLNDKLDFDRDMQASVLSDAQAQYHLGDLLLHMNRLDDAEAQLQKAVALDTKFSASYASLGLLRIRQGKNSEALPFLTQAVEGDSQNHLAHFYFAQLLQQLNEDRSDQDRTSRLAVMRTHLEKSIQLAPRFTQAYNLLGYVALVSREGLAEAETAVRKAIEYAPGRMELQLRLAELMVANNEVQAAQSLLTALKSSGADDVIRDQAERMLDQIKNRQAYENDLRAFQTQRRQLEEAESQRALETRPVGEPPKLTRRNPDEPPPSTDRVIETAKPQMESPEGIRVGGFLAQVYCSNGLTLSVLVGGNVVVFHTDTPSRVEFMSYVSTVKDTFSCGPTKPEIPVAIVYKRGADTRFLGELLRVDSLTQNDSPRFMLTNRHRASQARRPDTGSTTKKVPAIKVIAVQMPKLSLSITSPADIFCG